MDNRNGNINKAQLLSCLKQVRDQLHDQAPLIHCITHPIVVNDCANAVLALGGRPIMAEHPAEVADISASAAALTVSLGNITDARAESMLLAGKAIKRMKDAENAKRASVIDLVGITCSPFRMELAKRFIKECKPAVIKGNGSEIRAIAGAAFHGTGVDVSAADAVTAIYEIVKFANVNCNENSSKEFIKAIREEMLSLCTILGIIPEEKVEEGKITEEEIQKLIDERTAAKKSKDFARADEIRNELLEKGVVIEDTRAGVRWSYK